MRSLLRADRLRYRRRVELWLIGGAVVAFAIFGFLAGYRTDAMDPQWPTADQIRADFVSGVDFGGMTDEEIEAEIDRMVAEQLSFQEQDQRTYEESQALLLQKYDIAQSPFTMVGMGILPMVALVFTTTLLLGDEFRYGTVRTSLLAATDRRQFLVARLITFGVMIVGLFAALILAGGVLAVVLRLLGAEIPPMTQPLNAQAGVALFAAELLIAFTLVAFAVALTLLTRSGALPLLILLVWALAELFIFSLQVFQAGQPLAAVPDMFLTTNIRDLLTTLSGESGAITFAISGMPQEAVSMPTWAMAAIVAAWAILFLAVADRRFRTMDIVE
jgi:ABC-2 family transporter protein